MRIIFALVAKYINNDYLPYLGFLAIMPAIGFSYIFIFGKRKKGGETFGQKIWWNHLRPIHALLYALFAYLAINKKGENGAYALNKGFDYALHRNGKNQMIDAQAYSK